MEMCYRNDSTRHQSANNNDFGAFTRDMQIFVCITHIYTPCQATGQTQL